MTSAAFPSPGSRTAPASHPTGGGWPALDASYAISHDGGDEPAWSPNSRELCDRHRDQIVAVAIGARSARFEHSAPRVLCSGISARHPNGDQSYDVAPDGRLLMPRLLRGQRSDIQISLNWIAEVRARLERTP